MSRRPRGKKQPPPAAPGTVALALGGGGARGLAHIVVLEEVDALELRPAAVAGTSMGAVIGACWCAGIPAQKLRSHVLSVFNSRADVMSRLFQSRSMNLIDALRHGIANPMLLDGVALLKTLLPPGLPETFEELTVPFTAIAGDVHGLSRKAFSTGPLLPALAASIALPGLIQPVTIGGRVYLDGGSVDPLPVGELLGRAEKVLAVDVSGAFPDNTSTEVPTPAHAVWAAFTLSQVALTEARLAIVGHQFKCLRPAVQEFGLLDFFRAAAILKAAEPLRGELRRKLA